MRKRSRESYLNPNYDEAVETSVYDGVIDHLMPNSEVGIIRDHHTNTENSSYVKREDLVDDRTTKPPNRMDGSKKIEEMK